MMPGPGHFNVKQVSCDRADIPIKGTGYKMEQQTNGGTGSKQDVPGPDHYKINYAPMEEVPPKWTVPKDPFNNFIDKAVRVTLLDKKKGTALPGPGHFPVHNVPHDKITRGTLLAQTRGISRTPMS